MQTSNLEDEKDITEKLEKIYIHSPMDYLYLKGFIHSLLQKNDSVPGLEQAPRAQSHGPHKP